MFNTLTIAKFPKLDNMNFYNIVELEEILDDEHSYFHNNNEKYEYCNNYSPKVNFYRPYYKTYKKEKYWDNTNDSREIYCNSFLSYNCRIDYLKEKISVHMRRF